MSTEHDSDLSADEDTDEDTVYELTDAGKREARALAAVDAVDAVDATPATVRAFSRDQLDLIKRTVAAGTSDDEFRLFIEVCRLTGLNPFLRQIYAILRRQNEGGQWVNKMTIQTGIDGYRLLASRTGQLAGIDDPTYDTEDGAHPSRASITVYRLVAGQRFPFSATARWSEYAATTKDGHPAAMWARMPWLMLGKVAEALALRRAFPAELSGIYTPDEMAQADNSDMTPAPLAVNRAERPVTPQSPHPAPARRVATPAPAQTRTGGTAKPAAVSEWTVGDYDPMSHKATRDRLTQLGYTSISQVEEFLTGVRAAGEYSERSIKQAVVALEAKAAAAARDHDLQTSGAFAETTRPS